MSALNFKALKSAVQSARDEARREARQLGRSTWERSASGRVYKTPSMPFVRSRGTLLCTADRDGQCSPNVAAECPVWGGTKREIEQLVQLVLERYDNVTAIYIEGGFDISETMSFDDYEPMASTWEVNVWQRDLVCGYVQHGDAQ